MTVAAAYVFTLGDAPDDVETLGGKGASLVRIAQLGLPVPPAFIVSTAACRDYMAAGNEIPSGLWAEIEERLASLEEVVGRRFGDDADPLLVSVRSGAAASMPGMMDTVLNVGLTEAGVDGFARVIGDEAAAFEAYGRLIQSYGESVHGIEPGKFPEPADAADGDRAAAARERVQAALSVVQAFPQDPRQQLRDTVEAVLRSWMAPRAVRYRRFAGIPNDLGTAVIVQAMVFGNVDEQSGTGVAFTRDPATGTRGLYGDFLARAQGDDVVGGERNVADLKALAEVAPAAAADLDEAGQALERTYNDLCDIEFTVERGRLWVLQARRGQRSAAAAIKIALDLVEEGSIDWEEALERIPAEALLRVLDPVLDPAAERTVIGRGVAASPGTAVGTVAFTPLQAEELAAEGTDVILVRPATSPWDIAGMIAARGIVTARGGRTSHAAVVARGMSRPAVCGVGTLRVEDDGAWFGEQVVRPGDSISIDGARGEVYAGALPVISPSVDARVDTLLARCDEQRVMPVLSIGAGAAWADGVLDPELPVVAEVGELDDVAGATVVLAPGDPDGAAGLVKQAIRRLDGSRLIFQVPDQWPSSLKALPPADWAGVAASERGRLAARLLAAVTPLK
jgi:pyruvate,orthophosphate dikinase